MIYFCRDFFFFFFKFSVIIYFGRYLFLSKTINYSWFLWIIYTIFVAPLLFFTPMNLIEAMKISFKVVAGNFFRHCLFYFSHYFSVILVFPVLFGLLFTFPFGMRLSIPYSKVIFVLNLFSFVTKVS